MAFDNWISLSSAVSAVADAAVSSADVVLPSALSVAMMSRLGSSCYQTSYTAASLCSDMAGQRLLQSSCHIS